MYNQSCYVHHRDARAHEAAKGTYGGRRNWSYRSEQRASVNIHKTDNSYEMLVFAPGRIKEHFKLDVQGNELTVSYTPPDGFPRPEWVLREYSRGGFARTFTLNDRIDSKNITAKYADGVLQVSLPLLEGEQAIKTDIPIN